MSWFNRRPRTKEPPKQAPRTSSPTTTKLLKDAKEKMKKKVE